jgi:sugar phosphate isomerase/epimerase
MGISDRDPLLYSRRDFGRLALAGVPASLVLGDLSLSAWASINSKIRGVQIGAITYSFRSMPDPEDIIKAYVTIGLGEMELMSGDAEKLAGAPSLGIGRGGPGPGAPGAAPGAPPAGAQPSAPGAQPGGRQGGGRRALTPEEQAAADARAEALRKWRMSTTAATFKPVRKKIEDAGIDLRILCYNMNVKTTTDDEIEYGFMMAKALDVKAISTSTQVSMAKRTAPFADKHKMLLAYHGHDNLTNPDEVATPESFTAVTSASKYHRINLDIGHFTAANFDPVEYLQANHDRITHLHVKDRKKDHGPNVAWGTGDTPIKAVLLLLRDRKWDIPANIEFEIPGGDPVVEVAKCYQYAKEALTT